MVIFVKLRFNNRRRPASGGLIVCDVKAELYGGLFDVGQELADRGLPARKRPARLNYDAN